MLSLLPGNRQLVLSSGLGLLVTGKVASTPVSTKNIIPQASPPESARFVRSRSLIPEVEPKNELQNTNIIYSKGFRWSSVKASEKRADFKRMNSDVHEKPPSSNFTYTSWEAINKQRRMVDLVEEKNRIRKEIYENGSREGSYRGSPKNKFISPCDSMNLVEENKRISEEDEDDDEGNDELFQKVETIINREFLPLRKDKKETAFKKNKDDSIHTDTTFSQLEQEYKNNKDKSFSEDFPAKNISSEEPTKLFDKGNLIEIPRPFNKLSTEKSAKKDFFIKSSRKSSQNKSSSIDRTPDKKKQAELRKKEMEKKEFLDFYKQKSEMETLRNTLEMERDKRNHDLLSSRKEPTIKAFESSPFAKKVREDYQKGEASRTRIPLEKTFDVIENEGKELNEEEKIDMQLEFLRNVMSEDQGKLKRKILRISNLLDISPFTTMTKLEKIKLREKVVDSKYSPPRVEGSHTKAQKLKFDGRLQVPTLIIQNKDTENSGKKLLDKEEPSSNDDHGIGLDGRKCSLQDFKEKNDKLFSTYNRIITLSSIREKLFNAHQIQEQGLNPNSAVYKPSITVINPRIQQHLQPQLPQLNELSAITNSYVPNLHPLKQPPSQLQTEYNHQFYFSDHSNSSPPFLPKYSPADSQLPQTKFFNLDENVDAQTPSVCIDGIQNPEANQETEQQSLRTQLQLQRNSQKEIIENAILRRNIALSEQSQQKVAHTQTMTKTLQSKFSLKTQMQIDGIFKY